MLDHEGLIAEWSKPSLIYTPPPAKGGYSLDPAFAISYHVPHYPNWFHRLMQRWLLGIYWRKL